jgi:hypothetical protein
LLFYGWKKESDEEGRKWRRNLDGKEDLDRELFEREDYGVCEKILSMAKFSAMFVTGSMRQANSWNAIR